MNFTTIFQILRERLTHSREIDKNMKNTAVINEAKVTKISYYTLHKFEADWCQ